MAIADFRGSDLGETYESVEALQRDMMECGYRVVEKLEDRVVLDEGSVVTLKGEVSFRGKSHQA